MNFRVFSIYLSLVLSDAVSAKPNIVLIISDDMGWNDVGFHGNNAVKTPNIDSLAYNGIILNRHYVLPSCTPSRAALLTGKYPIRTGLQGHPIAAPDPKALPLEHVLLPEYLQQLGYKTHLIGKWHLGYYKKKYTPTERGFDSFFGYYNGWLSYENATNERKPYVGHDARRNFDPAKEEFIGKYVTDVFTEEAVKIIRNHDNRNPLFLELCHTAVHALPGNALQVKDEQLVNETFGHIEDGRRRLYAGTLESLDESVGNVISALDEKNLLNDCLILFASDNGGATTDLVWNFANSASNWPLRGMKMSVTEGGIRGTAVIWHSHFKATGVSNQLFHITDWLPTLYSAAGGKDGSLYQLDGINLWNSLLNADNSSASTATSREELLVNIDEISGESAYIYNNWKLIRNKPEKMFSFADNYAGAAERDGHRYNVSDVIASKTDRILRKYRHQNRLEPEELERTYLEIRSRAEVSCNNKNDRTPFITTTGKIRTKEEPDECFQSECLFNIVDDPCERYNRLNDRPEVADILRRKIVSFSDRIIKQEKNALDERADPKYWGGYWSPWLSD